MWATTKPKRMTPVAAMTIFLPIVEVKKLDAAATMSP
jgi:hypothetical protein